MQGCNKLKDVVKDGAGCVPFRKLPLTLILENLKKTNESQTPA